jgi:hypothetical protein
LNFDQINNYTPKEIVVPSVRDNSTSFCKFWEMLYNSGVDDNSLTLHIKLTFHKCNYFSYSAVTLLGSFISFISKSRHSLLLDTDTIKAHVFNRLEMMDFFSIVNNPRGFQNINITKTNIVPFRMFQSKDDESIVLKYLKEDWLSKGSLNLSPELRTSVLSSLWEIFANAFEHGESDFGVFCSGDYDKESKQLKLIVGDIGIGIVDCVRNYHQTIKSSKDAIQWALESGNSTYTANLKKVGKAQPRGLGLFVLQQFVDVNKGTLEIYTDNLSYIREDRQDSFIGNNSRIKGSWIKVILQCDESVLYHYENETLNYF